MQIKLEYFVFAACIFNFNSNFFHRLIIYFKIKLLISINNILQIPTLIDRAFWDLYTLHVLYFSC